MKWINGGWWYTIEESRQLLKAIFPNFPSYHPRVETPRELWPPNNPDCKLPKEGK